MRYVSRIGKSQLVIPPASAAFAASTGLIRWSRRDYEDQIEFGEVMAGAPQRLDVRLNGRCNLECVMCDVWRQPNGLYDGSDFWTWGPEHLFPHLREIDVLGGEPFMQSDTYRLLDEIWAVNRQCTWAFVTNAHYRLGPAIRDRLDRIAIRWFQVSLDSIRPETYARVRLKGDLRRTLATFEEYRAFRAARVAAGRGFPLVASMCVQRGNWREVGEFLDFVLPRDVRPSLQFAYSPASESLLGLPEAERRDALAYLESLLPTHGEELLNQIVLPLRESFAS